MFQYIFKGKDGSGSGFGSWKTVRAVPAVSGKTVPTVPVSGSGSVPEPPCLFARRAHVDLSGSLVCPLREVHVCLVLIGEAQFQEVPS